MPKPVNFGIAYFPSDCSPNAEDCCADRDCQCGLWRSAERFRTSPASTVQRRSGGSVLFQRIWRPRAPNRSCPVAQLRKLACRVLLVAMLSTAGCRKPSSEEFGFSDAVHALPSELQVATRTELRHYTGSHATP